MPGSSIKPPNALVSSLARTDVSSTDDVSSLCGHTRLLHAYATITATTCYSPAGLTQVTSFVCEWK